MWQYMTISDISLSGLVAKANQMGAQGWEAVNFNTTKQGLFGWGEHIMLLKRRIEPGKSAEKF